MDTTDRIVIGGGITIMAAFYLACGALLARLLGVEDSPLLWLAVTTGWPIVLAFLGFLLFVGVAIVARLFDAISGGRS
jgi:hypothetical protein